jgi:DNA-binding YbaB/EbfC family protein
MGSGFLKRKKEAKQLQAKMAMLQQTLSTQMETLEADGQAGNGLVTIVLGGSGEMKRISIKPECIDKEDIEGLEALIKAAHSAAFKKLQTLAGSMPSMDNFQGLPY